MHGMWGKLFKRETAQGARTGIYFLTIKPITQHTRV